MNKLCLLPLFGLIFLSRVSLGLPRMAKLYFQNFPSGSRGIACAREILWNLAEYINGALECLCNKILQWWNSKLFEFHPFKIGKNSPTHQKLDYKNLSNFGINPWPFQSPKIPLGFQMVNNLLLRNILKLTFIILTQPTRNHRITKNFKQFIIVKVRFLKLP